MHGIATYIYLSYAALSSGILWNNSHESLEFSGIHRSFYKWVCIPRKYKWRMEYSGVIPWERVRCITILNHAIENTIAGWEGWVWYSWIALIDGKVWWNTGSIEPITLIWVSLERSFPLAEVEYRWCQFWSKVMTPAGEQRPGLIKGGYGKHRSQWISIYMACSFAELHQSK